MNPTKTTIFATLSLATLLAVSADATPKDVSDASSPLLAPAEGAASGRCRVAFRSDDPRFEVAVKSLLPYRTHTLAMAGYPRVAFTTDAQGSARVRFAAERRGARLPLAVDPRGAEIAIHDDAGREVLAGVCAGEGEAQGSVARLHAALDRTELAPMIAAARVDFALRKDGSRELAVELFALTEGSYEVFVDGIARGDVSVDASRRGSLRFGDEAGDMPLDFDPRNKVIDIMDGDALLFTGDLGGHVAGVNRCEPSEVMNPFASLADGMGSIRLRTRADCSRDFVVELDGMTPGAYAVLVNGAPRGTVAVEGEHGYARFTTRPSLPNDAFLDFDPTGATVEVADAAGVRFSAIQGAPSLFRGGFERCAAEPVEIQRPLIAAEAGAWGQVKFIRGEDCDANLKIDVRYPVDGKFDVAIDGQTYESVWIEAGRGTITVSGEVVPGESAATLEPIGRRIELLDAGTPILQRFLAE
jgi:hypothetical protein